MTLCESVRGRYALLLQPWTGRWALASQTSGLLPTNRYLGDQGRRTRQECHRIRTHSITSPTSTRQTDALPLVLPMPRPPTAMPATPRPPASTSDTIHTISSLNTSLPTLSIPRPPSTPEHAPSQAAASPQVSSCPSPQSPQTTPSSPLLAKD